ncbi:MAG: hypothetical protein AB1578_12185 [Thermodesulfobacteriota bacterium]|jgi:hypothetical protein
MRRAALLALLLVAALPAGAAELPFHGFLEVAGGARVVDDAAARDDVLLEEARFQLDFLRDGDRGSLAFRADFVHDGVDRETRIEIREANVVLLPWESVDLKAGRQVLTWGTGDLIFLNDLFPKDWQSFFLGRDDEYLKKPSDALRATWFGGWANLDLAWTPVFEPDGFLTGERLSYWNAGAGRRFGPRDPELDPAEPPKTLGNGTLAGRLYGSFGGWETALYGYRGRYGQPKGVDPGAGEAFFPRLEAWGASARGALLGGIANAETAWYRSLDDPGGSDPNRPNDELRFLAGFTREVLPEQNLGLQAYLERALSFPAPGFTDQNRWWLTARYTGFFLQQNLTLSLFAFYSPSEDDAYLRPKAAYKLSDEILLTLGANVFLGSHDDTFFGQFEDNTNVYARVRYSF